MVIFFLSRLKNICRLYIYRENRKHEWNIFIIKIKKLKEIRSQIHKHKWHLILFVIRRDHPFFFLKLKLKMKTLISCIVSQATFTLTTLHKSFYGFVSSTKYRGGNLLRLSVSCFLKWGWNRASLAWRLTSGCFPQLFPTRWLHLHFLFTGGWGHEHK